MSTRSGTHESAKIALENAAWRLFADRPPADVTTRAIAEAAACTHGMVTASFGGKGGLETAVATRLAGVLEEQTKIACAQPGWPFDALVAEHRAHPRVRRLLVRAGLGELPIAPVLDVSSLGTCLVERIEALRGGNPRRPTRRARVAAYGVGCMLLGLYTFEEFFVRATGADTIPEAVRDAAMAEALTVLAKLVAEPAAALEMPRRRTTVEPLLPRPPAHGRIEVRDALIDAAFVLLATRGPAAISTREIAARAGVNHGLIHRHFGSKEALLTAALDRSTQPVLDQATRARLSDVPTLARVTLRSLQPWVLARLIIDDVDIFETRPAFPVVATLLETYPNVPSGPGPGNLRDPRLALMAGSVVVGGAAVWDRHVRQLVGLPVDDDLDIDRAVTEFAERLLNIPRQPA